MKKPYISSIGAVTKAKAFYLLYLENGLYFGRIARSPESDFAFEIDNWDFFSKKLVRTEALRWKEGGEK